MRIFQFIEEYCKDLVQDAKQKKALVDLSEFPHDGFSEDVEGNRVPVVYIDGESVPVSDFFSMDKNDFCHVWKLPSAQETYDSYMGLLEILEGEEAVNRIRNAILEEKKRLETDVELVSTV